MFDSRYLQLIGWGRPAHQSRIEALQGELLERILSDLQDIKAVLWRCSLVSKAWREAVSRMYPRDLELPNTSERRTKVTPEKVLQLMQWLQGKHAKRVLWAT